VTSPATQRAMSGWGRNTWSSASVTTARDIGQLRAALSANDRRPFLPRGLGRAYGDAALNGDGEILDMTSLAGVRSHDPETGLTDVWAGTSIDDLLRRFVPRGWFPPVTPGTRYVTVGGAIASDVHGKNHHVAGSFSQHVTSFNLLTPDGELRTVRPGEPAFRATAGGMGLTGVIVAATVQLLPVRTSAMLVRTERLGDLDALMSRMQERDGAYRYSVAWLDTLASGRSLGRGVLTCGEHAELEQLEGRWAADPLRYRSRAVLATPPGIPGGLLRPATVGAFNELWFRRAAIDGEELESIGRFFYPLDGVRDWNRIYGPRGFLQYQYVVPDAADDVVTESVRRLSAARSPAFLAVLKRFGAGNDAPLSFPMPGWTLALDLPESMPGLTPLLRGLDELVTQAGGRVYLSKDSRLTPETLQAMYPRLEEWRSLAADLDPQGRMASDLSRRVGLRSRAT